MPKKLFITEERMLMLIDWAVKKGIAKHQTHFLNKIGYSRQNIGKVKRGGSGFNKKQILKACILTDVSTDYIFGLTNNMQRKKEQKAIDQLKEAVNALELELTLKK